MIRNHNTKRMQDGENHYSTSSSIDYAHDDIDDGMDEDNEMIDDAEDTQFDVQTQVRLDADVDRLLKGYDWTLAPLANK
jgi:hypothetical protein